MASIVSSCVLVLGLLAGSSRADYSANQNPSAGYSANQNPASNGLFSFSNFGSNGGGRRGGFSNNGAVNGGNGGGNGGGFGGGIGNNGGFNGGYGNNEAGDPVAMLAVAVPGGGVPGEDYPILSEVPDTGFTCEDQLPGYYADTAQEAGCQVFHICQVDGRHDSFLCPNGTIFNQQYFVCDWWFNFDCSTAEQFFDLNADIGKVNGNNDVYSNGNGNGNGFNGNGNINGNGNGFRNNGNGNGFNGNGNSNDNGNGFRNNGNGIGSSSSLQNSYSAPGNGNRNGGSPSESYGVPASNGNGGGNISNGNGGYGNNGNGNGSFGSNSNGRNTQNLSSLYQTPN